MLRRSHISRCRVSDKKYVNVLLLGSRRFVLLTKLEASRSRSEYSDCFVNKTQNHSHRYHKQQSEI
jgi:hypothetical protein